MRLAHRANALKLKDTEEVFGIPGCFEPFAARLLVRQPDRFEHFALGFRVGGFGPTARYDDSFYTSFSTQQFARVFALVAAELAKLIQKFATRLAPPPRIPRPHRFHDFFFARIAHF